MDRRTTDPGQQGGVSGGSQGTGGISGGDDHGRKTQTGVDPLGRRPERDEDTRAPSERPAQGNERGYDEAVRGPDDDEDED